MKISNLFPKLGALAQRFSRSPSSSAPVKPPPLSPKAPLPSDFKHRLVNLRRRYRLVFAATGLFMLFGAMSGLFLAQGLADWWFELPWTARAVFLAADLVLLGLICRHHLRLPLQTKLGLSETALLVEKKWPQLGQCVITAVEMAEGNPRATGDSRQLVDVVMQQVRARTSGLDFNEVVSTQALRRWAMYGGGGLLVFLMLTWAAWPSSLALLERICLINVPLPTKTAVVSITRDMIVPVGSDVVLSARAKGIIPAHGGVTVTYDQGPPLHNSLLVLPDQPATFSFIVHNVQRTFKYRFTLNDGRGPEYTVQAKVPPALAALECTQIFPGYTRIPPRKLPPTELSLLAGSHLRVTARATATLKSATVIERGITSSIPMTLTGQPQAAEADIPIPAKGLTGFSIHLVDAEGVASANDAVHPVQIVPDRPPLVKIVKPEDENQTITPAAKPLIVFDASDDYGLSQLSFNYELVPPAAAGVEPPTNSPAQPIPIRMPPDQEGARFEFELDVAAQQPAWQIGWTVRYWIEAVDNNTTTGPGITRTDPKQFSLVTPEAKQAEIMARVKEAAANLNSLSATQEEASRAVGKAIQQK